MQRIVNINFMQYSYTKIVDIQNFSYIFITNVPNIFNFEAIIFFPFTSFGSVLNDEDHSRY